ncbi:MAG: hypothetical protein RLZ05_1527 [Bacteroidota bacterium]|jgi:hypothetical protein
MRIRVGIVLENICKITDHVQNLGQLQSMCPCMGLINGCKFCAQVLLEVPSDIQSLEMYLGDGHSESIAQMRQTCFGQNDAEEEK